MNTSIVIILLVSIVLIIVLINKIVSNKEKFEEYKIKANSSNSIEDILVNGNNKNIFVGAEDATKDENGNIFKVNEKVNLGTNNTIFIKDGINLSYDNGGSKIYFDIDYIRAIKYLPYNFDEEICIRNSCINKHHLKYIKGKTPFTINTFTNLRPFQLFSKPNYYGWQMVASVSPIANLNIQEGPMKSIKITSKLFKVTCYSEPDYQGQSVDITEDNDNLTSIFPEGVKSIIPKSIKGELLNNMCLAVDTLDKQPDNFYGLMPAPCDSVNDPDSKYFYFMREDLLSEHKHLAEDVHFHEHSQWEKLHHE